MGYYSDVALTVRNEDFNALVEKSRIDGVDACEFVKSAEIYQKQEYTTLYWSWVKWNPSHEEIAFVERFMSEAYYIFHRLGEDDCDYERRENIGGDDEYLSMHECVSILREFNFFECAGDMIKAKGSVN